MWGVFGACLLIDYEPGACNLAMPKKNINIYPYRTRLTLVVTAKSS